MSHAEPLLSVVICTLDRVDDLPRCFESLCGQARIGSCEILVVNDGATERCVDLVRQWVDRIPVRYVKAGFRSLGKARNLGWREARAPIVAYLDDDACAKGDWLESLLVDFAQMDADYSGQTGPVEPDGDIEAAIDWMHPSVARQLCSVQPDREASMELFYPECLLGCNMAFRRAFLEEAGGFSPVIQSFDEAFVVWPGMKHGRRFYFNRRMRAAHQVDPKRLTWEFLLRKGRGQGAAYQRLLPMLRQQGIGPHPLSLLWTWMRPLGGFLVGLATGRKHWQSVFAFELRFWFGRVMALGNDVGDYYESPKDESRRK